MNNLLYDGDWLDMFLAGFIGIGFFLLLATAASIFMIVCWWKLYEMAGEDGWKTLIPFYNHYIRFKLVWETKYFFASMGIIALWGICTTMMWSRAARYNAYAYAYMNAYSLMSTGGITVLRLISFVLVVALMAITVAFGVKTAHAYGKSTAFGLGIAFVQPVFIGVLAFGKTQYVRNKPSYHSESMKEAAYVLKEKWDRL